MLVAGLATWVACRLIVPLAGEDSSFAAVGVAGLDTVAIGMRTAATLQALFMLLFPAATWLAWRDACARFHALRSAFQGHRGAIPTLRRAAKSHLTARIRKDLRAWL